MPGTTEDQLRRLINIIVAAKQAGIQVTPTEQQIAEAQRLAQQQGQSRTLEQIIADYKNRPK